MSDTMTIAAPPTSLEADSAPASPTLEDALDSAFPSLDAPEEALAQLADAPAAPELLAVAPRPRFISLEELLRQIANSPLIIIRRIGIPLATLLAVAAAILLHLILVGGFLLAFFFFHTAHKPGVGNAVFTESGGSGDGYMIQDSGPLDTPALNGSVDDLLAHAPALPPAPTLPPLPDRTSSTSLAAQQLAAAPTEPEWIGIPGGLAYAGQPRPQSRAAPHVTPPALRVVPPTPASVSKTKSPSSVALAGRTAPAAGSTRAGEDDGGSDDEGPVYQLFPAGSGGDGHGHGHKSGNGSGDLGDSAANNPDPTVLDMPQVELPLQFHENTPDKDVIFEVVVRIDGTPGKITLTQSCGIKDVDELCLASVRQCRFRPAYVAGKPVEKTKTITLTFGAIH